MIVRPPRALGDSPVWFRWNGVLVVREGCVEEMDVTPGLPHRWRHPVYDVVEEPHYAQRVRTMDAYRDQLEGALRAAVRRLPPVDPPVTSALVARARKILALRDGTTYPGERASAQLRLDDLTAANPGLEAACATWPTARPGHDDRYMMVEWAALDGRPRVRIDVAYYHAWPGAIWRASLTPHTPLAVSLKKRPIAFVMPLGGT